MLNANPKSLTRALLTTAAMLSVAAATHAVTPGQFTHTTEADFADGDPYGTVVTNLGDIKLSSDITPLDGLPEDVTVIHDIERVGNDIYVAAGPEATLLKLVDGVAEVIKTYQGEQVFSLGQYVPGQLLIGVSAGDNSRIEMLRANGPQVWLNLKETKYIWDMATVFLEGEKLQGLLIATGTEGKLLYLDDGEDEPTVLLETQQANILSLAADDQGNIYAGTDTDGLVYRIDTQGNPFVVYDAPEAEVAALAVMPDGTVYAGTAAADQARPGRLEQPIKEETGRPEVEAADDAADAIEEAAEDAAEAADAAADEAAPEPGEGADDAEAADAPAAPTPEQYDALRETLRQRLEVARETGQLSGDVDAANGNANANNNARPDRPSRARPAAPQGNKRGNAVYRIAPDGFVAEVFRESAMILAIVPQPDGKLVVATGNEGQVFSVDPDLRETTVLADLDSAQVTCATPTDKGLLLGAANPGALMRMDTVMAEQGGYTSRVLDAGQVSLFGTFKLTADIPAGATVAVELRSGNVGDPEQAAWSKWTDAALIEHDPSANPLQPREIKLDVPPARYLQYRLTLTGDGSASPVIDQADLAYVAPNTPPSVAKLTVNVPEPGEPGSDPDRKVTVQWQATDDNSDRLVYTLEYKPGGADRYLPLADDLTGNKHDWQTQHVPDGWYTLRLTAHDKLDNPPDSARSAGRVSEPVLIDNTAPALDGLKAEVKDGTVTLTATVEDELSAIASVGFSVDGSTDYQASLPNDMIYDSTSEPWSVTIPGLSRGGHVIAVRAIDARGNTAYRQLIVDVD